MSQPPPGSPRSDMRGEIVERAAQLLADGGAAAVTTRAVADAAGVQPPTIYRLFGDKDGLLDAVADHVMARHVAKKSAELDGQDPIEALRAGWRRQIDFGVANPDLTRLMNARDRPSPAVQAGIVVLQQRIHRLAAAGLLRVSEPRAITMLHAAGGGAVQALLELPPGEEDPGLADAMLDAVLSAITTKDPTRAEPDGLVPLANAFAAVVPEMPGLSDAERSLMNEWVERSIRTVQDRAIAPS